MFPRPRAATPSPRASGGVTRKDFTDRLGLPESASNEEVFAAVDRAKARRKVTTPAPVDALSAEDARLYAKAWPR